MVELQVCMGSACHVRGAYNVIQTFQQIMEEKGLHDKISFNGGFCMKQCGQGDVGVDINGNHHRVAPDGAREFFTAQVLPLVIEQVN